MTEHFVFSDHCLHMRALFTFYCNLILWLTGPDRPRVQLFVICAKFILQHFEVELKKTNKNIFSIWEMCTSSVLCQWILIILMMRISSNNNSVFPAHVPLGVNSDDRTRCEVRLSATRGLFIAELDKTQPSCCCFPPVTVKPHTVSSQETTHSVAVPAVATSGTTALKQEHTVPNTVTQVHRQTRFL